MCQSKGGSIVAYANQDEQLQVEKAISPASYWLGISKVGRRGGCVPLAWSLLDHSLACQVWRCDEPLSWPSQVGNLYYWNDGSGINNGATSNRLAFSCFLRQSCSNRECSL